MTALRRPALRAGLVSAVLLVTPLLLGGFRLNLLIDTLIIGLAVASLDVLIGYTGMLSLGHAAFFGTGAYAVALLDRAGVTTPLVALPAALALGALVAVVLGWFATEVRGIAFIMVTLAFAEILFVLTSQWRSVTNGDDGLSGLSGAVLSPGAEPLQGPAFYYYALVVCGVGYLALRTVVRSPFGQSLRGIRSNPARMTSVGYWVKGYRLGAFTIAGAVAGLAGGLYAQHLRFVSPAIIGFTLSALMLVMHKIGGGGTLWGPVIGTGIVLFLRDELSSRFDQWQLVLGVVFVLVVYFLPDGVAGLLGWRRAPARRGEDRTARTAPEPVASGPETRT